MKEIIVALLLLSSAKMTKEAFADDNIKKPVGKGISTEDKAKYSQAKKMCLEENDKLRGNALNKCIVEKMKGNLKVK